ncbi:MAG: hypothetical protein QM630_01110 [Microbacterium sp.]
MNVNGIDVPKAIPDTMIEAVKDQLKSDDPAKHGIWLLIGDQASEGSLQIRIPHGAAFLLTRLENDPAEAQYVVEWNATN